MCPIRKDTLYMYVQLLLEFFTELLEIMHICSTWSEDVLVVWGYPIIFNKPLFQLSFFQV